VGNQKEFRLIKRAKTSHESSTYLLKCANVSPGRIFASPTLPSTFLRFAFFGPSSPSPSPSFRFARKSARTCAAFIARANDFGSGSDDSASLLRFGARSVPLEALVSGASVAREMDVLLRPVLLADGPFGAFVRHGEKRKEVCLV
jgi:hypothetical protein